MKNWSQAGDDLTQALVQLAHQGVKNPTPTLKNKTKKKSALEAL